MTMKVATSIPDSAEADGQQNDDPSIGLERKTARGALVSLVGQAANFVLRTGSMVIMARLVTPEQFGLVSMVSAFTGFLGLFRDLGLSQATVQRVSISHDQTSTLFWINVAVGALLAVISAIAAPAVAAFYGDQRLVWIMLALGSGYIFSGASVQHRALLQREMRFAALVAIDVASLFAGIVAAIWMALAGMGYWALVVMAVSVPAFNMLGMWLATGWIPGMPRGGSDIRSMVNYGGTITLNGFVVYLAYNADKVLLGRFWGAETLGFYGRAYQLISLPTDNLNTTIGWVMFPALSRVQNDPARLRSYFLKAYGIFLAIVIPVTVASGLFAHEIVLLLLGAQWHASVPVFQLLTPTILSLAVIHPFGCLMHASGRALRSLKISLVIAPVVILGCVIGLPYGADGVALGYSLAMLSLVVPVVILAKRGTLITSADITRAAFQPFISTIIGAAVAVAIGHFIGDLNAFARLLVLTVSLFSTHLLILLFGFGQKQAYLAMVRAMGIWPERRPASGENYRKVGP